MFVWKWLLCHYALCYQDSFQLLTLKTTNFVTWQFPYVMYLTWDVGLSFPECVSFLAWWWWWWWWGVGWGAHPWTAPSVEQTLWTSLEATSSIPVSKLLLSSGLLSFKGCVQTVRGGVSVSQFICLRKGLALAFSHGVSCSAGPSKITYPQVKPGGWSSQCTSPLTSALAQCLLLPEPRLLPSGHYKIKVPDLYHNTIENMELFKYFETALSIVRVQTQKDATCAKIVDTMVTVLHAAGQRPHMTFPIRPWQCEWVSVMLLDGNVPDTGAHLQLLKKTFNPMRSGVGITLSFWEWRDFPSWKHVSVKHQTGRCGSLWHPVWTYGCKGIFLYPVHTVKGQMNGNSLDRLLCNTVQTARHTGSLDY